MKKPVIAVDCDDVLVETADRLLADYELVHGVRPNSYTQLWEYLSSDDVRKSRSTYLDSQEYIDTTVVVGAADTLRRLSEKYNLFVVTGRPGFMQDVTLKWINKHLPHIFKGVIITSSFLDKDNPAYRTKAEVCKELGAEYLIDDNLQHCEGVSSVGISTILFGQYSWNATDKLPDGVTRCKNWQEVAEYFGV